MYGVNEVGATLSEPNSIPVWPLPSTFIAIDADCELGPAIDDEVVEETETASDDPREPMAEDPLLDAELPIEEAMDDSESMPESCEAADVGLGLD